jgi:hypothetical protein
MLGRIRSRQTTTRNIVEMRNVTAVKINEDQGLSETIASSTVFDEYGPIAGYAMAVD